MSNVLPDLKLTCSVGASDTIHVSYQCADSKRNTLLSALYGFWRWKAEGSQPCASGFVSDADRKAKGQQFYYDSYHDHIEMAEPKNDVRIYSFRIQTDDGPDGDTWWTGHFRVVGMQPEILDEKYESN